MGIFQILPFNYSDKSDGSSVLDGVNTFSWAELDGSVYTLKRNVYFINLQINAGITLAPGPYSIFGSGTLTNSGIIDNSGGAGVSAPDGPQGSGGGDVTPGGFGGNSVTIATLYTPPKSAAPGGNTGADGNTADGQSAADGQKVAGFLIPSGDSGSGGNGAGGVGGTGGSGNNPSNTLLMDPHLFTKDLIVPSTSAAAVASTSGLGAPGGASGAGDGVNNGGGGGQGGGCGGTISIWFAKINNLGTIRANGGNGGHGETPAVFAVGIGGGGGGGGGCGGFIFLVANQFINLGTLQVNPGVGGAAGLGKGTGTNGAVGTAGTAGIIKKFSTAQNAFI